MKNWYRQLILSVFIGLFGVMVNLTPWGLLLEEKFGLYWLFQLRGTVSAPDDVVVISIDESSAIQLGLPIKPRLWSRELHANLIENLANAGARVIVFDLLFETPGDIPENDEKLARVMQKARNVIVVERLNIKEIPLLASQADPTDYSAVTTKVTPLLSIIESAALAQAPFLLPDSENINAYWTFKTSAGYIPTLPVVALQAYTMPVYDDFVRLLVDASPASRTKLPMDKTALNIKDLIFTLRDIFDSEPLIAQQMIKKMERDPGLNAERKKMINSLINLYSGSEMRYLNFYGPPRSVQTIPYHHALPQTDSNPVVSSYFDFNGKVVFIGFSGATQPEQDKVRDHHRTAFTNPDGLNISGVEIAATAFANLLDDKPIRLFPHGKNLILLFLLGFTLSAVFLVLPNRSAAIVCVVLVTIYVGNASYQLEEKGTWLPLFIPFFMQLPLAVFGSLSLKYYIEKQKRKQIEELFGRFLPERVLKHIKESAGLVTSNNQLVYGVCLATDVKDYTPLSEKMKNPGRLFQLTNDYYAVLFKPVEKNGGEVSDVVGDAMLALWTATSINSDLRKKACLACLEIAAAVDRFNQADNRPKMVTRFGLHWGQMMLGSVGASQHFEYRAVGDVVNTANRIQGANKKLGTRLLVSGEVAESLDDFLIRPLGGFLLVGKSSPVILAELITNKQAASSEQLWLCEAFASALQAYQLQQWQQCIDSFSEILRVFPDDGPARFFLARCQQYKLAPPPGSWSSVIQMTDK